MASKRERLAAINKEMESTAFWDNPQKAGEIQKERSLLVDVVENFDARLKELEAMALSYPGVLKTYAIQAGRELRVIVGSEKVTDKDAESLSFDIAKKIQDEMTYPGQVKITVIRETRAISYAK